MLPNVACLCARISARMLHEIVRHLFSLNRPLCVQAPFDARMFPPSTDRCQTRSNFVHHACHILDLNRKHQCTRCCRTQRSNEKKPDQLFSVFRTICTPTAFIVTVNAQTELDDCSDGTLHASCAKPSKPKLGVWPSSSPRPSSSLLLVHRALNPATAGAHPKRSPKE